MAKTKLMPRSSGTQHRNVSAAAKRPDKTNTFLDEVDTALTTFDDEVTLLSAEQQENAYTNLATSYKKSLSAIWDKASAADIQAVVNSVDDKQLLELQWMTHLLESLDQQAKVVSENRAVPNIDNILGAMTYRLPTQELQPAACDLISTIFRDLAQAHKYQMEATKGIADLAGLITPEQLSLVLAAAVPPTIHLVLPPGTVSPLTAPPPAPTTTDTTAGRQDIIRFCKTKILPNPKAKDLIA